MGGRSGGGWGGGLSTILDTSARRVVRSRDNALRVACLQSFISPGPPRLTLNDNNGKLSLLQRWEHVHEILRG